VLTKKEAARLLGISERTLRRRMQDGTYKYTRLGDGQFAEVRFTYADLGLEQPRSEPEPVVPKPPKPEPKVEVEPEPEPEPFVIHNGIVMSPEDARKHEIRNRNRKHVDNMRRCDLQNIGYSLLGSGRTRQQLEQEINERYDEKLRKLNRGIR
jgi:excisionase family DNA binding protein